MFMQKAPYNKFSTPSRSKISLDTLGFRSASDLVTPLKESIIPEKGYQPLWGHHQYRTIPGTPRN